MEIEALTPYTHRIRFALNGKQTQHFLLLSDIHWDNPKCDRKTLTRHLEQAKDIGAPVLIFGDLFCAMQGKYDPRASKNSVRPEHQVNNYLDALVDTAAEFFRPYPVLFISPGNHETAILRRQETDITQRLADAIGCKAGTYAGWIVFNTYRENGKGTSTTALSYHHGYGGGGPVTKDTIQASRKAVYLPDADIVVSGHTHDRWIFPVSRVSLRKSGEQVIQEQLHLKLGTYKDEYTHGGGWAVEKGMPPKQVGGVWLRFTGDRSDRHVERPIIAAELAQ